MYYYLHTDNEIEHYTENYLLKKIIDPYKYISYKYRVFFLYLEQSNIQNSTQKTDFWDLFINVYNPFYFVIDLINHIVFKKTVIRTIRGK